jgi:pyruvate,water dikinase
MVTREEALASYRQEFDTPTDPEHRLFTRRNAMDAAPRALTPLTISLVMTAQEAGVRHLICGRMGLVPYPKRPWWWVGLFSGYSYHNLEALAHVASLNPSVTKRGVLEQMFGLPNDPDAPPERETAGGRLRKLLFVLRRAPRIQRVIRETTADTARHTQRARALRARNRALDPTGLANRALAERLQEAVDAFFAAWRETTSGATSAATLSEQLQRVADRRGRQEGLRLMSRLLGGLGSLHTANQGLAVADLARRVRAAPALRALFDRYADNLQELAEELDRVEGESAVLEFQDALAEFFEQYGFRGLNEFELAAPAWEDNPTEVLAMIRNEIDAPERLSPDPAELARQRREAAAELMQLAGNPFRRRLIASQIRSLLEVLPARENFKTPLCLLQQEIRRFVNEAGRRWAVAGRLEAASDVYYLLYPELGALLVGEPLPFALRERISLRKAGHAACLTLKMPDMIEVEDGVVRPIRAETLRALGLIPPSDEGPAAAGELTLRGLGSSPGRAEGRARVITDPRLGLELQPGEVLVAHSTDPGWTPLFYHCAAVVVDVGGLLSHASTVAREYRIPAVVNVQHGTELIRTGDYLVVDGATGEVQVTHAAVAVE